jgi:hypothetical protein
MLPASCRKKKAANPAKNISPRTAESTNSEKSRLFIRKTALVQKKEAGHYSGLHENNYKSIYHL